MHTSHQKMVVFFEDSSGRFYLDHTGGWSSRRTDAIPVDDFQIPFIKAEKYDWDRLVNLQIEPL